MTHRRDGARRRSRAITGAVAVLCSTVLLSACSGSSGKYDRSSGAPMPAASSSGGSSAASSGSGTPGPSARRSSSSPAPQSPTVAPGTATTLPPVPIRSAADFGTGLSVRIAKVGYGTSTGAGRGGISGQPVVTLTLVLRNTSGRSISVNTVQVETAYGSRRTPAIPSYGSGTKNFSGALAKGRSSSAVYQFIIPVADEDEVNVTVWYRAGAPVALLRGSLH